MSIPTTFYYYLPETDYNKNIQKSQTYFGNTKIYSSKEDLINQINSIGQTIIKSSSIKYNNKYLFTSSNTLHIYNNEKNYGSIFFCIINFVTLNSNGLLTRLKRTLLKNAVNNNDIIDAKGNTDILYATDDYSYLNTIIQTKNKLNYTIYQDENMAVIQLHEPQIIINKNTINLYDNILQNINIGEEFELLTYATDFNSTYNNFQISQSYATNNIINIPNDHNYLVYGTLYNDITFLDISGKMLIFSLNYEVLEDNLSKNILNDGLSGYMFFVEKTVTSTKTGGFIATELNNKQLLNNRGIEISTKGIERSILKVIFSDGDFAYLINKYIYYDTDNTGVKTFYIPKQIILSIYKNLTVSNVIPTFYFKKPIVINIKNSDQTTLVKIIDIKDNRSIQEYTLTFNLYSDPENTNNIGIYIAKIYYYQFTSNNLKANHIFVCTGTFYFIKNNVYIKTYNLDYKNFLTSNANLGPSIQNLSVLTYNSDDPQEYNNLIMKIEITNDSLRIGNLYNSV